MSTMTINGKSAALPDDRDALLVDVIRDGVGLTGTKLVCGSGVCGACTVLLDGAPVASCLLPAQAAAGKSVTTVEGLAQNNRLGKLQKAFIKHDAFQCGYCTAGQLMSAAGLLNELRKPTAEQIRELMSGNLCRCGAYPHIVDAILEASS